MYMSDNTQYYMDNIDEMLKFIDDYDIYLYSVLNRYAAEYNYDWYCALKSRGGKTILHAATKKRLQEKKKDGTLPPYDLMNRFTEFEELKKKLPPDLLVTTLETNIAEIE